jgi:flavorubredoxin
VLDFEEAKYFANILLPYSSRILSLLDQLAALDLPLQVLAPDHGPVWRRDFTKLFDFYRRWALQTPGRKAVILYDTMWGSTEKMARAFSEGIVESGCEARPCSMSVNHRSDAALEILEAGALVAGSPTINDHLFPTLADCLTYLRGLKPRNLLGAVFGSYGWNGRAVVQLREFLESMKVELPFEDIKALYVPGASVLEHLRENGRKLGKRLLAQKES